MLVKAERYFLCFLSYSVLGWLYEVFLEVVVYRWGFSNRGVLFGPYCPIYGVGALVRSSPCEGCGIATSASGSCRSRPCSSSRRPGPSRR